MSDLVTAWALVAAGLAALAFVVLMRIYLSRSPNQPWAALDKEEARVWLWAMLLSLLWPVAIPVWLVVQFFRIIEEQRDIDPLGVVRVTIQTPDTRGPWDQREAEAAAAGLAVAAILAAAGDGTATLAIHCWPAESGTQAHVYARVPADAARTLTDEHPLTRDESLLWPLWTGTVCGAPVTITTP